MSLGLERASVDIVSDRDAPRHRDVEDRAQQQEQNQFGRATFHRILSILHPTLTPTLSRRERETPQSGLVWAGE